MCILDEQIVQMQECYQHVCFYVAFALVPFLKDILGRLLPMLLLTKQENMKWVFAHCKCSIESCELF